jgi:hypothetical protein
MTIETFARHYRATCEGCGLPDWTVRGGMKLSIRTRQAPGTMGYGRPRDPTTTVWVCSEFCGWQTLAIGTMGKDTCKWPIRFKEFISANPRLLDRAKVGQTVTKLETQVPENAGSFQGGKARIVYQHDVPVFVTQKRGRPRKHEDNAERQRAYRRRAKPT